MNVTRSLAVVATRVVAVVAVAAMAVGLGSSQASAAQIFIQQSGTAPAGGDPNVITDTTAFVLGIAGNEDITSLPLLVTVADLNGEGPAPTISFSGCAIPSACPLASVGTYGLTANPLAGFGPGEEAYTELGLVSGSPSVSFTNMAATLAGLDPAIIATSFTLYTFAVPAQLGGTTVITLDTTAGAGDFIFAYTCDAELGCTNQGGSIHSNVYTNTGLIDGNSVPEPATLMLLGGAMVGFVVWSRKR